MDPNRVKQISDFVKAREDLSAAEQKVAIAIFVESHATLAKLSQRAQTSKSAIDISILKPLGVLMNELHQFNELSGYSKKQIAMVLVEASLTIYQGIILGDVEKQMLGLSIDALWVGHEKITIAVQKIKSIVTETVHKYCCVPKVVQRETEIPNFRKIDDLDISARHTSV